MSSIEYIENKILSPRLHIRPCFDCDGFEYSYGLYVPKMDFTSHVLKYSIEYYAKAISNLAYTASLIWVRTHHTNKDRIAKLETEISTTAPSLLPCPKKQSFILIPLKIIPKINPKQQLIKTTTVDLLLDDFTKDKLNKNKTIKMNTKKNTIHILNPYKWEKALKREYKHEWIELDNWLNKKWSISIEKRESLDWNMSAMLHIKLFTDTRDTTVTKQYRFNADFHINPSSKNLYNFQLFSTTVPELDSGLEIGRKILNALFKENTTLYAQEFPSTIASIKSKKKPYEMYRTVWATMCAFMLERKVSKRIRGKLSLLAYTKNKRLKTPVATLIPLLYSVYRDLVHEYYDKEENAKRQVELMEELNINTHRFALGFSANDYKSHYNISVYAKDYYQYLSKLKRVSKTSKLKNIQKKQLDKISFYRIKEKIERLRVIRIEITIRGWETIHTSPFLTILDEFEKVIDNLDKRISTVHSLGNNSLSNLIQTIKDRQKMIL